MLLIFCQDDCHTHWVSQHTKSCYRLLWLGQVDQGKEEREGGRGREGGGEREKERERDLEREGEREREGEK